MASSHRRQSSHWSRARALRNEAGGDAAADETAAEPGDRSALGHGVVAALMRLSVEQRAVVVMRFLLELTPGEIAEALDLPRGTVNSRLRRGLDALGELVGGDPR